MRRARVIVAAALTCLLAGCPTEDVADRVELFAFTAAPPASRAVIVNRDDQGNPVHTIELSVGVALAVRCTDSCGNGVCEVAKLTATDPELLGVRPVYRGGRRDSELVLIAREVGMTTLLVQSSCAAQTYRITVASRGP